MTIMPDDPRLSVAIGEWSAQAALAKRQIAVIVNAKSRRGQDLFAGACEGLKARGFTVTVAHAVKRARC